MATFITSVMAFKAVGLWTISYTSSGTSTAVATNGDPGPAQATPKTHRLHPFQQRVGSHNHAGDHQVPGADREQARQLVFDGPARGVHRPSDATLQIADDSHEIPLQQRPVRREHENRHGQYGQNEEMQHPFYRD